MKRVYLAGPVTGLTFGDCTDWREYAKKKLFQSGITGVSPMRGKEFLALNPDDKIKRAGYPNYVLATSKGIITRDRWDCMVAHIVLANFLGAKEASLGTAMELAWADAVRTPIIVVMEKSGNVHDHAMINEVAGYRVETLDEGLSIVNALFKY